MTKALHFDMIFKAKEFYEDFREAKKNLPWRARFYIYLREVFLNPILLIQDKKKLIRLRKEAKKGEVKIRSGIELALMECIYLKALTGEDDRKKLEDKIKWTRLILKYINLLLEVMTINLEKLAYIFMIVQSIIKPGICTVVYPISIFGYALLHETRPPKQYWYFILGYTQILMVLEFFLSLNFIPDLLPKY